VPAAAKEVSVSASTLTVPTNRVVVAALDFAPVEVAAAPAAYRTSEVCRDAGITFRMLDYWCRTGVISPSVVPARGCGTVRLWSEQDLIVVRALARMNALGAGVDGLRALARALEHVDLAQLPLACFVNPDGAVYVDRFAAPGAWFVIVDRR
jgi:hypothetical protein